jgi:alpha-mannosidase
MVHGSQADIAHARLDGQGAKRIAFLQSVAAARKHLQQNVYAARNLAGQGAVALVGHSHLDIAYHWRVRQGIRKNARTTAVQLALMDEYPEFRYCHTQPYLYESLKKYYPELYRRMKAKIRSGQWELVGAAYVEPDCLVPSGESLIRQFLLGKQFFLDEFGVDVDTCWLPDVFGNSWKSFPERTRVGESLNMYGFGDGGGGVTREMLETARRIHTFPGLPRTRLVTGKQYLEEAFAGPGKLDVWDDELYLEMHRGTTTTKAILKKLNRRCELVAHEAEMFGVLAGKAQHDTLTAAWKKMLLNQFHDILPGSHVNPVGQEAEAMYRDALATVTDVRTEALRTLAGQVNTATQPGRPVVVFNSLNWTQSGIVELPGMAGTVSDASGMAVPAQATAEKSLVFLAQDVPPIGHAVYYLTPGGDDAELPLPATTTVLENRFFRMELDANGEIASLFDRRANREVLAGPGNHLHLFEDKPGIYDAWDILPTYEEKEYPLPNATSLTIVETGPVRTVAKVVRMIKDSRLEQRIILYEDIPRIDFATRVDWQEHNHLLKVAFPVAVLARQATYDLSYGTIQRPTHANTSWDKAKFEVCGHQWADLSEGGYGVSLLNDSKYGWDIRGNVMRLTLLRGPIRPDPVSDIGQHEFTYSLYPHAGDWRSAGTSQTAMALNSPPVPVRTPRHRGNVPGRHSYLTVVGEGVFLGAMKKAERGKETVLRIVETRGGHTPATVHVPGMKTARECDFIERPEAKLAVTKCSISLPLKPYQIRTVRIGT